MDKSPVIGFENNKKNFFQLVAQGGYGIQTAPALSKIAKELILGNNENKIMKLEDFYNISINRLR